MKMLKKLRDVVFGVLCMFRTGICAFMLYRTCSVTKLSRIKSYVSKPWQVNVPAMFVCGLQCRVL